MSKFYAKRGWGPLPAFESILTLASNSTLSRRSSSSGTRFLTPGDITTLCERDVESVTKETQRTQVSEDQILAAVAPSADLITLLQERASFMASKQGKVTKNRGAISRSEESWIYWYHDFRKHQLAVLRIHPPEASSQEQAEQVASLLLDALEEASAWSLPKVTVWDANSAILQALEILKDEYGVKVASGQRDRRSIPSLRWKGGDESKRVTLHCNEFYAWS